MTTHGATTQERWRRRLTKRVVLMPAILAAAVVGACVTHAVESTTFYHPFGVPAPADAPMEDVFFTTSDGVRLHGWWIPPEGRTPGDPPAPAVIHCHGNAGCVENHLFFSEFLPRAGVGVLLFDYRGFGRSDGCSFITRNKLMLDTCAALDYLLTRPDVDPTRLGVYGYSLGGAFALALAAERPEVRAVCTVAAFASWSSAAADVVPVLGTLLIPPGLDPSDSAAKLGSRPYLVVHGNRDRIVNVAHADRLAASARAAGVRTELLIVPGAGHVDEALMSAGPQRRIAEFFRREHARTTRETVSEHEEVE